MVLLGYAVLAVVGVGSYVAYVVRPSVMLLPIAVAATSLAVPQLFAHDQLGAEGFVMMSTLALTASTLTAWRLREEHRRGQAREMSRMSQP